MIRGAKSISEGINTSSYEPEKVIARLCFSTTCVQLVGRLGGMKMRFSRLLFVALCFALSAMAQIAQASGGPGLMKQIKESIAKVSSEKTVDARTEAAERLASLTQKVSSKEVTEALMSALRTACHHHRRQERACRALQCFSRIGSSESSDSAREPK